MNENIFGVNHVRRNKPTSKQYFTLEGFETYEDAMHDFLNEFSNSIYGVDYWYPMMGTNIIIKRLRANNITCEYSIKFMDNSCRILKEEFLMEIEVINDSKEFNILKEELDLTPQPLPKKEKIYCYYKWFKDETHGMKSFLFALDRQKDISKLKKYCSKSQYWRYKKRCVDNGYVKDGRLIKKLCYIKYV